MAGHPHRAPVDGAAGKEDDHAGARGFGLPGRIGHDEQAAQPRKVRVTLDVQDFNWGGSPRGQFHEMVISVERVRKLLAIDPTCDRFRDYARVK